MKLDDLKMTNHFFVDNFCLYYKKLVKEELWEQIMHDAKSKNIDRFTIRTKKTKKLLEESTGADPEICSSKELLKNYRFLKSLTTTKKYLRGKFEMWFFLECCFKGVKSYSKSLNDQIKAYNQNPNNTEKIVKIDCKVDLEEKNIFLIIPTLMKEIPSDINDFLALNHKKLYGNN